MIDSKRLLTDLQAQVARVEADLHAQLGVLPEVDQRLRNEHQGAFSAKRTAASATEWIGERVTQSAVAWVLATVFVRFCEDNSLLTTPYFAGPVLARQSHAEELHEQFMTENAAHTHRDWLLAAFSELGSGQAGNLLFSPRHNPLYQIDISHDAAKVLIDFWRKREDGGESTKLTHSFYDPKWDTRFLGDIYQDLSSDAREKYALLQTPDFVEEFILDRTLGPAIGEFGHDVVKVIDPTCGSGHFVLGAFHRLLSSWEEKSPSVDIHTRVRSALDAVHGVDINPFAVAIAKFRLFVAALKASGVRKLRDARTREFPLHIATGDALLKSEQLEIFAMSTEGKAPEGPGDFSYTTEDVVDHLNILQEGRYHVVVGNPPYIAAKDRVLNGVYRDLYKKTCSGKYALTVPFAQRFFSLAVSGGRSGGSGYVGQITSNSFMKREFGEKLIQNFLANEVDLTEVIDTSGAYIPGHGTPTVILIGRNRRSEFGARTVRAVRGIKGESIIPKNPADGLVWREIEKFIDAPGKNSGEWVSVDNLERKRHFSKHPWILNDGGLEAISEIGAGAISRIAKSALRVGVFGIPGADEAMLANESSWLRRVGDMDLARDLLVGDDCRDWNANAKTVAFFPYTSEFKLTSPPSESPEYRWLWPSRTALGLRATFSKETYFAEGREWFGWHQVTRDAEAHPWTLTFGFTASHNHFSLERTVKAFKQTAPVIKLHKEATEGDHLEILGLLNSSTACFWLKQVCQERPNNGVKRGLEAEKWTAHFDFNGTNVQEFPLPARYPLTRATELDALAQQLTATSPAALTADPEKPPTAESLAAGQDEWHRIRARMIAVQEELDWEVYGIYGLHDDLTAPVDSLPVLGLELGQRAFEIDLGDRVKKGEAQTEWFRRHNSTMISEIPSGPDWPEEYRRTVARRLEAIKNSAVIGLVERPEYKRRWLTDGWDSQQKAALREWLLARMERRDFWYVMGDDSVERPRTRTVGQLIDDLNSDTDFVDVAALYTPGEDLATVVPELISDQHVPFLAALRYKESAIKKKRSVWEQVWDMQRAEDDAAAEGDLEKSLKIRDSIPVPPKYVTADFVKPSYAAQRGGLDVPKERFISYSRTLADPTEFLGWGGWDHQEQALALVQAIEARREALLASTTWDEAGLTPLLAGLLELLPWVRQWHPDHGDFYAEVVADYQRDAELTDEALRGWRSVPARRGGGRKPAKKTVAAETRADGDVGVAEGDES
ncbi:BREX-2 system adenine-specific DNA-methyltransferase PglX [Streptomyces sp. NPDC059142]|uniref:BREX-2 system adenine-specific DNA-methyltransferase PglX n=1 Tax=Streptomyces sp. NPDC059142 TaxID=3346739 RepID=UPI0036B22BC1